MARQDPISGQEGCNALNKLEPTFHYGDKPFLKSHWNIFYVRRNSLYQVPLFRYSVRGKLNSLISVQIQMCVVTKRACWVMVSFLKKIRFWKIRVRRKINFNCDLINYLTPFVAYNGKRYIMTDVPQWSITSYLKNLWALQVLGATYNTVTFSSSASLYFLTFWLDFWHFSD